ncbi:glycerophosphodiester phosphodiesterase [Kineococcus gypseus]|uniref:glycerophosphodiester phosphodiesterase n=1 Tax=Kineococcus gypseus TaxID=1637102 RepID=UPI003D7E86FC
MTSTARRPLVVAHRGYSAVAPENTLAAFEAALRAGADLLELDVHLDAAGVPVVLHDGNLERTTDVTGPVGSAPVQRLREADAGSWFSPAFAGQRVPTLAAVAELTARHGGAGLLVELKGGWSTAGAARVADVVRAAGLGAASVLQSFERATVAALRDAAPDLRRALLVLHPGEDLTGAELTARYVEAMRDPFTALCSAPGQARARAEEARAELGVVACNPFAGAVAARPEVVAEYHAAGVATHPWTVDDPVLWAELVRAGVDGIITNDPARLRGWLDARAEGPTAQDVPPLERAELVRRALPAPRRGRRLVAG